MNEIMTHVLLTNISSETTWQIFTKFHVSPIVETGFMNGQAPLTVIFIYVIYKKKNNKKKKHIFFLQNQELLK